METVKNQKFEKITNGIGYWEPSAVSNENKEKTSFSLILEKMYIGGSIGYYLSLHFGGKEYSAEVARIRVAGETAIADIEVFFQQVVSAYQEEKEIRKPCEYAKLFRAR